MPGTPEDASSKLHTIDERLQEIDQNSAKLAEVLHKLRAMDTSRDGVVSREEFLASGGTAEEWQRFESRMDDIEGVSILTGQDLSSVSKQEDLDWFASLIFDQQLSNVPDERLLQPSGTWRLSSSISSYMLPVKLPCIETQPEQRKEAVWRLFVAGGVAGGVAKTIGSPLSRATILMQTQAARGLAESGLIAVLKEVIKKDGLKGLVRGNTADVLRSVPMTGLSFLTYGKAREALENSSSLKRREHPILQGLVAGSASGFVAISATYPLDLLRTRMCVTSKGEGRGLMSAASGIVKRQGVTALYAGLGPALAASVPKLATIFVVNDATEGYLVTHGWEAGPSTHLMSAVTAAIIASSLTFPLDVVSRSMQVQGTLPSRDARKFNGAIGCIKHLYKAAGPGGFYRGLLPELCKCVPVQATCLVVNTWMLEKLGVRTKWETK